MTKFVPLFLICASFFATTTVWSASNPCIEALTQVPEFDAFVEFDALEGQVTRIGNEIGSNSLKYPELSDLIGQLSQELSAQSDRIEKLEEEFVESGVIDIEQLKSVRSRLKEIIERLGSLPDGSPESIPIEWTFNDILLDPTRVESNKVYRVKTIDSSEIRVAFTDKIVKEVFHSIEVDVQRSLGHGLRLFEKGVFGRNFRGNGIIRLQEDNSLVEVRTRGVHGAIRIYGYFYEGVLYISAWRKSSDHSTNRVRKVIQSLHQLMDLRGHR